MIQRYCRSIGRALSTTVQCLEQEKTAGKRLLKVAIVGAPNAGKSTILNKLVGYDISCVSKKVHTTRKNILGVYTENESQLQFYDSPGLITRQHLVKHRLDQTLLDDPEQAAHNCDLIAVVIDASNIREQKRLNKGILKLLSDHSEKQSILILNKVDLVKEKRLLIDIGVRLTQGCLNGRLVLDRRRVNYMPHEELINLNLVGHLNNSKVKKINDDLERPKHKYVIDLEDKKNNGNQQQQPQSNQLSGPDMIGFKSFSNLFSISALKDDGIDDLREHLLDEAKPVEIWPHGPDYLSNQTSRDIVHQIIRGKVLDYVDHAVPYLVDFKFLSCNYDEMSTLNVNLIIVCPERYMVPKVLGEKGVNIFRIVEDSRELITKTLGCEVKLSIQVEAREKKRK